MTQIPVRRAYTVSTFVERLDDETLKYDVTLVDEARGVDVKLRICLFGDEPISCENHATREATQKHKAISKTPLKNN